jgi:monothiol glutaredoxin
MNVQDKISQQVTDNAIVLYMKGIPHSPQCGFSAATVQLLNACGVQDFTAVDVLADPEMREMHEEGELQKLIASVAV